MFTEVSLATACTQTTALDISGKHVFVTRFVHPQNPPPPLTPGEDTNRTSQLMVGRTQAEGGPLGL